MKTASMIGSAVVTFALLFYSIGFFKEKRARIISQGVLTFFTIGIIFDITATVLMIIGSSKGMLTLHGVIGYSSLTGMLIETTLLWKQYLSSGQNSAVSKNLHIYSGIAYTWWVIAYITGGLLVMLSKVNA